MEFLERAVLLLQTLLDTVPTMGWAIIVGLLVSWAGTQWLKRWFGLHGRKAAILALVLGFLPTYSIAPGWGWEAFWVALLVGLAAPFAYRTLIAIGRERGWTAVTTLSGDRPQ